jgi:hypothetical protein
MKQHHDMDPIIPQYMYLKIIVSCLLLLLLTFIGYHLTMIMQQELI